LQTERTRVQSDTRPAAAVRRLLSNRAEGLMEPVIVDIDDDIQLSLSMPAKVLKARALDEAGTAQYGVTTEDERAILLRGGGDYVGKGQQASSAHKKAAAEGKREEHSGGIRAAASLTEIFHQSTARNKNGNCSKFEAFARSRQQPLRTELEMLKVGDDLRAERHCYESFTNEEDGQCRLNGSTPSGIADDAQIGTPGFVYIIRFIDEDVRAFLEQLPLLHNGTRPIVEERQQQQQQQQQQQKSKAEWQTRKPARVGQSRKRVAAATAAAADQSNASANWQTATAAPAGQSRKRRKGR
jgi:hypothetical protein